MHQSPTKCFFKFQVGILKVPRDEAKYLSLGLRNDLIAQQKTRPGTRVPVRYAIRERGRESLNPVPWIPIYRPLIQQRRDDGTGYAIIQHCSSSTVTL